MTAITKPPTATTVTLTETATQKTMRSRMSESALTSAAFWSGVATVVLTVAAAIAGVAAWYFSDKLAAIKDDKLATFQTSSLKEIESQRALASRAESELLTLKKRAQPRRLSADQETLFASLAASIAPKIGTVHVVWQTFDPESQSFAGQINELLKKSGFSTKISPFLQPGGIPVVVGVTVLIRDPKNPPSITQPLAKALRQSGVEIDPTIQWGDGIEPDTVEIIVGSRQ